MAGKRENACNQHFLLFLQLYIPLLTSIDYSIVSFARFDTFDFNHSVVWESEKPFGMVHGRDSPNPK